MAVPLLCALLGLRGALPIDVLLDEGWSSGVDSRDIDSASVILKHATTRRNRSVRRVLLLIHLKGSSNGGSSA